MSISFNSIPSTIRVPFAYVEFDNSKATQGPALLAYKALIIGQMTTGTATANTPVRVTSAAQAKTLFGAGSMLHRMFVAWFAVNAFTEVWALPLADDGAAVDASGTVAFTGPATAAGTVSLYVGGTRVRAAVANGDTATTVATAVRDAINADTSLPVTATASTGTVTITAKNGGLAGNYIDLRLNYYDDEALPAGISAVITGMASGATNPSLTTGLANLGDEWYHVIAFPYTDASSLTALETELSTRFGPLPMIDAVAFTASNVSHGSLGTLGDSRNSPHVSIMGSYGIPNTPMEVAAAVAGSCAYYSNIDPARPLQTLPLTGMLAPKITDRFTVSEKNTLLYDGISTFFTDAGGVVRIERCITTYKTNAAGADDTSYLDVETLLTLMYLRYDFRTYFTSKYPRHKLADDGTRFGPGQAIITPKIAKAECIAKYKEWESIGLVEDADSFKEALIVERNISDPNRLDFLLPPDLVNQFRVLAAKIEFRL